MRLKHGNAKWRGASAFLAAVFDQVLSIQCSGEVHLMRFGASKVGLVRSFYVY